jgi:hypothetical protein
VAVESERPQDVERSHHRRVGPTPETEAILERYRAAMRSELAMLLEMLGARRVGLMPDAPGELVIPLGERTKLWDLAVKLGRELGAAQELGFTGDPNASEMARADAERAIRPPRARKAPRLTAAQRRALGAE